MNLEPQQPGTPDGKMPLSNLDAEVQRVKDRLAKKGAASEIEKHETAIPLEPDNVLSIAEVMPDAIKSFERMAARAKEFRDEQRTAFDAAADEVECLHHRGQMLPKLFEETCRRTREAGYFCIAYAPCDLCQDADNAERKRSFWSRRGMPQRVIDATFKNFATEEPNSAEKKLASVRVRDWLRRRGTFLILIGTPGTGKGHLAASCLRAQGDGLFITHPDLLTDLRNSYTLHTTKELTEKWQDAEMLVLDEFGLSPGGKDEESILYQVIAERHDKRRPTILTTNKGRQEVRELLGYRLLDRIREDVCEVPMRWESYRSPKL